MNRNWSIPVQIEPNTIQYSISPNRHRNTFQHHPTSTLFLITIQDNMKDHNGDCATQNHSSGEDGGNDRVMDLSHNNTFLTVGTPNMGYKTCPTPHPSPVSPYHHHGSSGRGLTWTSTPHHHHHQPQQYYQFHTVDGAENKKKIFRQWEQRFREVFQNEVGE